MAFGDSPPPTLFSNYIKHASGATQKGNLEESPNNPILFSSCLWRWPCSSFMVCISILKNKIKTNTHYVSILPLTFYHGGWKKVQYIYPSVCYCFYLIHPRNPITVTWSHPFFHSGAQLHPTGRSSPISPGPSWQTARSVPVCYFRMLYWTAQPQSLLSTILSSGYFLRSELTGATGKQIPLWRVVSLPKQHMVVPGSHQENRTESTFRD